jgi:hypothetical protein
MPSDPHVSDVSPSAARPDRPRERLLADGALALSDGDLLSLVLRRLLELRRLRLIFARYDFPRDRHGAAFRRESRRSR